jgi:hypothetical protein
MNYESMSKRLLREFAASGIPADRLLTGYGRRRI